MGDDTWSRAWNLGFLVFLVWPIKARELVSANTIVVPNYDLDLQRFLPSSRKISRSASLACFEASLYARSLGWTFPI